MAQVSLGSVKSVKAPLQMLATISVAQRISDTLPDVVFNSVASAPTIVIG